MSTKKVHKKSPAEVLSSVTSEMAKPRVVESAKSARGTLPDGIQAVIAASGKSSVLRRTGTPPLLGEE